MKMAHGPSCAASLADSLSPARPPQAAVKPTPRQPGHVALPGEPRPIGRTLYMWADLALDITSTEARA